MIHPFSDFNIYKTVNVIVAFEKRFKYITHCRVNSMGRDAKLIQNADQGKKNVGIIDVFWRICKKWVMEKLDVRALLESATL